jgi:hypothetical protein
MSSRRTSSVPKEDVVFPRMLYCDSRCSQTLTGLSLALPGALLCNASHRLGDRQRVILRQRVRGSVRAVRAVRNTRVFQMETRVVANELHQYEVFPTQSGKSYPGFLISARILHIVLIFISHLCLSRPQLYHHRRTQS